MARRLEALTNERRLMNRPDLQLELEQLHEASYGWALGCCRRNREDAEEVLQTVYVKVLEGNARFDGRSSLKTWLFAVIRRTAYGHMRQRWIRQRWLPSLVRGEADPEERADAAMERGQLAARLAAALGRLAPRQREILELVFYHDMTIEEAAQILGVSVGTARVHYDRGKKRLRSLLESGESHESR